MKKLFIAGAFVIAALTFSPFCSEAQAQLYRYAVKFVCGKPEAKVVVPGYYLTAINVHNSSTTGAAIRKKFSVALPHEKAGPVSKYFDAKLGPEQAFEIDCGDIWDHLQMQGFVKGFALIESEVRLNVTAVYTAAGADGQVESMDVETIWPRAVRAACADLIVQNIERPAWDSANKRSIIKATIKNIGSAPAAPTVARVVDPSTPQPNGVPYNAVASTPSLNPGAAATVTFYLPYWVYNPDALLEVTADYKQMQKECNEANNVKVFEDKG